jgi:ribosomal protein L37AE/L43A
MTTPARPEASTMVQVECPLCDAPAPFDIDAGVLACDCCGVALELADDDAPALAHAA